MKTKGRIRSNGSIKPLPAQSVNPPKQGRAGQGARPASQGGELATRANGVDLRFDRENDHPSCLCIFDRQAGKLVSKVPLSADEFTDVILARNLLNQDRGTFIAEAVREKLSAVAGEIVQHLGSSCPDKETLNRWRARCAAADP
jgi:hypothetical protein